MAKQLNVNLAFTADTKQVEQQLNTLRKQLTNLINTAPSSGFTGFTKEIQNATTAAATLKTQLDNAINAETGKLDLGKFNQSLKQSGMQLKDYKNALAALGPQGVSAFSQLAQSIMNAEMPLKRTSALLDRFAVTLKNTARWQISSTLLHGFMGSIQTAYYYAQDLNESLNNIRIVTGKNTDEMAAFAKEANEAAQALNTTTTAYTDASLIYYQQGLPDEEVKKRTDTTVKMANVTRQAAEEVSQQMTAIWNNFDDGSKSLEYYSDVITALGATTASSSAEIAEGLEKFAAVANTVGLSYEYATAALATVTAETRLSADVVGNAFKTLFARLEGLQLGETLEDGTDLNKYASALAAVGVNIKETNGDLKDMDQVLDELGATWQTLGKDQQVALAQTVGGVRQYAQLIALMDNWSTFQKNVLTARGSEGTLQEQAEIYAESWEAAKKRVKASAEAIYDDLLSDKAFIKINNGISKILDTVNDLIKAIGGVKGVLLVAGTLLVKIFGTQLTESINNAAYSLRMLSKDGRNTIQETKTEINRLLQEFYTGNAVNEYDKNIGQAYAKQGEAQQILIEQAKNLTKEQQQILTILAQQHQVLVSNVVEQAKITKEAQKTVDTEKRKFARSGFDGVIKSQQADAKKQTDIYFKETRQTAFLESVRKNLLGDFSADSFGDDISKNFEVIQNGVTTVIQKFGDMGKSGSENAKLLKDAFGKEAASAFGDLWTAVKGQDPKNPSESSIDIIKDSLSDLDALYDSLGESGMTKVAEAARAAAIEFGVEAEDADKLADEIYNLYVQKGILLARDQELAQGTDTLADRFQKLKQMLPSIGEGISSFAQATTSAAMAGTAFASMVTTLSDDSASLSQKVMSLGTGLGTLSRNITTGIKGFKEAKASMDSLGMASNVYLIAITAILAAVQTAISLYQKYNQAQIEASKASVETAEALREEVEANRELYDSYMELYDAYKEGKASKEDLYDVTDKLTNAYNLERATLAKLTGDYDALTASIKEANQAKLDELKVENDQILKDRAKGAFREARSGKGQLTSGGFYNYDVTENAAAYLKEHGYGDLLTGEVDAVSGRTYSKIKIDTADTNQLIRYYEGLKAYADTLERADTEYIQLSTELKELTDGYNNITDAIKSNQQIALASARNEFLLGANESNIEKAIDGFRERVTSDESFKNSSQEEIDSAINTYLDSLNDEVISKFLEYEALSKAGMNADTLEWFKKLSEGDQNLILTAGIDVEDSVDNLKNQLTIVRQKVGSVSLPLDFSQSINETLLKGNDINKDDFERLLGYTPTNLQNQLGADKDEFNNKSLNEKLDLLQRINQATLENAKLEAQQATERAKASQVELNNKKEELNALEKRIDRTEETFRTIIASGNVVAESSKKNLQELKAQAESLDAEINRLASDMKADLGTAFDAATNALNASANSILNNIERVKAGVELIGEQWIVAAEDVELFAQLLPELAHEQNMLADGRLQLKKEEVAEILGLNKEIINSDKDVVVAAIDNKIEQTRAEIEYRQKKIAILQALLKGEKTKEEATKDLMQETEIYREKMDSFGVKVDAETWKAMLGNAQSGSKDIIGCLNGIYDAVQSVHDAYGKMFSKEALAGFNGAIRGASGAFTSILDTSDPSAFVRDNFSEEEVNAVINALDQENAALDAANSQLASLIGTRAKILSGYQSTSDAIDRVNAGQAGKASSSSSSAHKKQVKELDEVLDRYWDINNAIESINSQLESQQAKMKKLETLQDHVFGEALIVNLEKQNAQLENRNKILDQQKANYQQLYRLQLGEVQELKNEIAGFGGTFDGDVLTNYSGIMGQALGAYESAINTFNASAQEEADEAMLDAAEKYYNKLKDKTERYQTLFYNELQDTQHQIEDLEQETLENRLKILENNLTSWEIRIDLKLEKTKIKRDWNEFVKQVQKDFRKIYQDLIVDSTFDKEGFHTYVEDTSVTLQAIKEIEDEIDRLNNGELSTMFASVSEAQEKLKEYQEQLLQEGNDLNSLYQQVWQDYVDGLDQVADKLGDLNNQYEKINDELEYEKSLVELLYGNKAYYLMNRFYEAQKENVLGQINSMKAQVDYWQSEFDKSYQMNKDKHQVDLNDITTWTEDMKKAYESMTQSQEDLNKLILEGIQILQDKYLSAINEVIDAVNKGVWGMALEDMKSDWTRIQDAAKEYLDDVEGAYQIQTLANKINQSIANTSSVTNQQKLQKLRDEEINMLREKDYLTQHDIDLAEARYQIALKEMALQDAQNSKTSMKLTRDASGNWTYQYVADESDVASKQQALLDEYNNLYKLADDAYNHAMELAMDTYQEMVDKISEIGSDMTLTEEEKMVKIQEIYDYYLPLIDAAVENSELYRQEATAASAMVFQQVCAQDAEAYTKLSDLQMMLVDMVTEHHLECYEDLRSAIVDGVYPEISLAAKEVFGEMNMNSKTAAAQIITDWAKDNGFSVRYMMNAAIDDMQRHIQNYEAELNKLQEIAGVDFNKIGEAIDKTSAKTYELADRTAAMVITSSQYIDVLRQNIASVADVWDMVIGKILEAQGVMQSYLSLINTATSFDDDSDFDRTPIAGSGSRSAVSGTPSYNGEENRVWGASGSPSSSSNNVNKSDIAWHTGVNNPGVYIDKNKNGKMIAINGQYATRFATGGYTGEWGSDGRFALLDQKELVLNEQDTKNMLDAVAAIRDMTKLNDSIESSIAGSISQMALNLIANKGYGSNIAGDSNTENQFYITAEFPNANDVNTIREAILGLPNIASQYMNQR